MKHSMPMLALLSLAACAPATLEPAGGGWGDVPAVTAKDYTFRDLATFPLTGQESLAEAAAVVQSTLSSGEPGEGNYAETLNVYSAEIIGQGRGAVVFTQTGLPDDAVETEQHVVEFMIDEDTEAASLSVFGTRQKCRRGPNPGVYTNRPCP